ncbi:uncharacterized protein LOC142665958 [Rhinoderma darwinii]|uniref:uncharacterized protein LOC142665958 n=1 Tax=Rhinoderma darwinii TaxID=43563 RepID=UPI003F66F896
MMSVDTELSSGDAEEVSRPAFCDVPSAHESDPVEVERPSPTSETAPPAGLEGSGDNRTSETAPPAGLEGSGDNRTSETAPPAGLEGSADNRPSETAPPAGLEGSGDNRAASSTAEDTVAPGSINPPVSESVPRTAATTKTPGRIRRRKSSPKKREMPDDIEFPLDIIVKEEGSDEEYRVAINADPPTGADGSLHSGIWTSQNGTGTPQWASQKSRKGRKKKRSSPFQKPLLIKSSVDAASLMFVIPNEEMESVVNTKKKKKRKEEAELEEMHWCDVCDECFSDAAVLEEHTKSHLDQPQEDFDCEDCGRVFDSASELQEHISKKHNKLRYCCDICGIQYNYKSQFVIHMRAHSGERPYVCDECGQEFGHKCSLVIHERKHTGVTPHQCRKCKKMCDTRVSLAKHEKMRYCPDCQKCYTYRSFAKHLIKNCVKA